MVWVGFLLDFDCVIVYCCGFEVFGCLLFEVVFVVVLVMMVVVIWINFGVGFVFVFL